MTIVINFSGGKDSSAMLAYICELWPDHKKVIGNSVQPDVPMFWMRALHNKLSKSKIKTA